MLNHPKPNQTTRSHKPHENLAGKRSAGNPHAAFEVAGAGNKNQKFQFLSKHSIAKKMIKTGDLMRQLSTLLKYADETSEADLEKLIGSDLVIKKAYEAINQFNWNEKQLLAYDEELKRIRDNQAALDYQYDKGIEIGQAKGIEIGQAKGIEIGQAKGKTERNIEIAKNLLAQNIDVKTISIATGLTKQEIEKLNKEQN
jgi:predicted transposase/invertase (TIGR01784 family)